MNSIERSNPSHAVGIGLEENKKISSLGNHCARQTKNTVNQKNMYIIIKENTKNSDHITCNSTKIYH